MKLRKAVLALVATLASGTTFTSCDSRVKSSITTGLEQTILGLLDPANFIPASDENDQ